MKRERSNTCGNSIGQIGTRVFLPWYDLSASSIMRPHASMSGLRDKSGTRYGSNAATSRWAPVRDPVAGRMRQVFG